MQNKRLIELDVFRGIAALSVVLYHYTTRYNITFEKETMNWFQFSYGHYGVQLFFIISGFVIFMTLERSKNVIDFIKRRFIRLYPTFWISMIVTFIVTSLTGIIRFERSFIDFFVNFTMIPNLLRFKAIDGVYWSLEVELLFYFFMVILLSFKLLKYVFSLMFFWFFVGILIQYFKLPYFNVLFITDYSYLFIAGISFYKIWKSEKINFLKYHILIFLCLSYGFAKNVEEGIIVLLCFSLFYLFIYQKIKFIANFKTFRFFGNISYALYLIHQFIGMTIIFFLSKVIDNYFVLLLTPLVVVSTLLAYIITYYIENPIQQKLKPFLSK